MAFVAPSACGMTCVILMLLLLLCGKSTAARQGPRNGVTGNFDHDFDISWAADHAKTLSRGQQMQLLLDRSSGSGFASKNKFLFGNIAMQIKLIPGDSAGTVTAYYLSSKGKNHDEIDFEFLGNVSGEPYILQTNIYAHGVGNREERIYLWFDPAADFHTYSVHWNPRHIIFYVDQTPVRVYKNNEGMGVPYLNGQAMGVFSSLWNADDWATQGGRVKTDWSKAPFVANYRNFHVEGACQVRTQRHISKCMNNSNQRLMSLQGRSKDGAGAEPLSNQEKTRLKWVRSNYMICDYCSDKSRYPIPPAECGTNNN